MRYVSNAETTGRPRCYSRSVSRVLFGKAAERSPSPIYDPDDDTMPIEGQEELSEDEDVLPTKGPMLVQWAASFNPKVLTSTSSSTYAPGAVGLEGF